MTSPTTDPTLPGMPEPESIPTGAKPPSYPWYTQLKPYAKALAAFAGAFLSTLVTELPDDLTATEWIAAVLAGLATTGVVYASPKNQSPDSI